MRRESPKPFVDNAEMKVMRSHLVGNTPEEAMLLANKESNQKFWNPNNNSSAYFSANYGQWSSYQFWYDWVQSQQSFTRGSQSSTSNGE
jgi:hypothetical protein